MNLIKCLLDNFLNYFSFYLDFAQNIHKGVTFTNINISCSTCM